MPTKGLKKIFSPETVAVIGASNEKDSVGYSLMANLIGHGYRGTVYPVNIKSDSVQGVHAYKSVKDIPRQVDMAIIATPAKTVPKVVEECGQAGVKGVVIISAGFKETGEEGIKLEKEVYETATKYGIRIIGPNCLGVINPRLNFNASFAIKMPMEGNIAFISQSGALCSSIIDWASDIGIGFSYFVSIGSMLDVDYGDLIDFFGRDHKTTSIVVYMESVKNAGKFMSAASGFAKQKPIVIVKSGRFEEGRKAVISHTGAIAGSDDVYSAAFKRAGVVRVTEVDELFDIAEKLAKGPLPKGPQIAVITNAGGPGVMATDKIIEMNGKLATLSEEVIAELDQKLPPSWSRNNPVDVLGDAGPQRYCDAMRACIKSRDVDSIMVMLTPQAGTDPTEIASRVAEVWDGTEKPITACWMGGSTVEKAKQLLREKGIPVYPTPEKAVMPLISGYDYRHNLELLHETPQELTDGEGEADTDKLGKIVQDNYDRKHYVLSELESKEFLYEYGINTNHAVRCRDREEAVKAANETGYPVVMKIDSPDITHKTDAGGVMLSIYGDDEVRKAFDRIVENAKNYNPEAKIRGVAVMQMVTERGFELLLGSKNDDVFGQVIAFGAGGTLVEVLRDKSIGLPPLNQTLARRMMEDTKFYKLLKEGSRDRAPADLTEIEKTIINFSQLIIDHPEIVEADINPLLACKDKVIALDARIVLDKERKRKYPDHLSITPYPKEFIEEYDLKGEQIMLRPIKPEDEPKLKALFESLSENTIHYRFFHAIKEITHEMLIRYCHNDYNREIAIVAEKDGVLLGASRLMFDPGQMSAEFAVVVGDKWQNKGLGSKLVKKIVDIAKQKDLEKVYATVIKENHPMKHVAKKLGFVVEPTDDDQIDALTLKLK